MKREVITNLMSLLERDNDLTRCWAAKALGNIGAQEAPPALIERLYQDSDPDVRMEAAAALGKLASVEGVETLINALCQDFDGDVRIQACIALGKIGGTRALGALITSLTEDQALDVDHWGAEDEIEFDATWEIQHRALEIIGDMGDARAVDTIIHLLRSDAYEDLQELGFRVLAKLGGGKARGFLLRQLQEGNRVAKRRVAKALAHMPDADVVQALIQALRNRDPDVRINAAQALAESREPSAVTPLLSLLKDLHEEVRREAAVVVATLPGDEILEPLLRLLGDKKRSVQHQAVQVLGERREAKATTALLNLLASNQGDEAFCTEIIKALGKIRAPEAIDPLCRRLKDSQRSPETRLQIVLALGDSVKEEEPEGLERGYGDETIAGQLDPLEVLIDSVEDDDEKVCWAALLALAKIGGARAFETLVNALRGDIPAEPQGLGDTSHEPDSTEPGPLAFPTSTLAAIQAEYPSSPSLAAHALSDRQRLVRCYAARIARETNDQAIVDALLQVAEAGEPDLQREALISLGFIGNSRALPVALQSLSATSRDVRLAAIEALGGLQPKAAVAPLITVLNDETEPFVLQRTIEVLGTLGDRQATACIAQRLKDEDREVRRAALQALEVLGDSGVIERVRPFIFAEGGELRCEAVATLKTLGDTDMTDLLLETLQHMEREENHWIAI